MSMQSIDMLFWVYIIRHEHRSKAMKKLLSILIVSFVIVGCSVPVKTPEGVLTDYFNALQSMTTNREDAFYIESFFDSAIDIEGLDDAGGFFNHDEPAPNEFIEHYVQLISSFDYRINATDIDGDEATVNVILVTFPLNEIILEMFLEIFASVSLFETMTDEEIDAMIVEIFIDISNEKTKDYQSVFDVKMVQVNNQWKIKGDSANSAMFMALMGGIID
jgi:hypothetical protein